MPRDYRFDERLSFSEGVTQGASVETILRANIPGAGQVVRAHKANDRNGTDWWVETCASDWLSIDAKVRQEDWAAKPSAKDDLALETWSVVERGVIGWTRNFSKRTDYILWLWLDTGRWCLIPFPMLCQIFDQNWKQWAHDFGVSQQFTPDGNGGNGYHSECVFVPRLLVWRTLYETYGGKPSTRSLEGAPARGAA